MSILTYESRSPTNLSCILVRMATKLYKYSSDQGRSNSFKHLSKQSIHINTFNIFSKVDRFGWLVVLRLNVPVNNFLVMSGRSHRFLGN